ncbi:MAG: AAA family ATPase [Myxococcota bacterium]
MNGDRITQLRIRGLRVIDDLTLDLKGLTVLIGDNGVGKSSIVEALELLRLAARPGEFGTEALAKHHGPFESLLRRGTSELGLGVTIEERAGPRARLTRFRTGWKELSRSSSVRC